MVASFDNALLLNIPNYKSPHHSSEFLNLDGSNMQACKETPKEIKKEANVSSLLFLLCK